MAIILRLSAIALGLMVGLGGAHAQQNTNIRGTITAFEGTQLTIRTGQGTSITVNLPETVNVAITKPFSLTDIKPGMALGVTTLPRADGRVVAIDVRPIPATANLGLSPWDLQPQSTMTNATFEGAAQASDGNELTLNYKTGTINVLVLPTTAMSQAAPGSRADLKPGERVFVAARADSSGALTPIRVQVSKDGINPTQ
jgi:hypothetical protein